MSRIENERKLWEALEKIRAIESEYGVRIGSCGCCESPWLAIGDPNGSDWACIDNIDDPEVVRPAHLVEPDAELPEPEEAENG